MARKRKKTFNKICTWTAAETRAVARAVVARAVATAVEAGQS
jgi:hypothetical protein